MLFTNFNPQSWNFRSSLDTRDALWVKHYRKNKWLSVVQLNSKRRNSWNFKTVENVISSLGQTMDKIAGQRRKKLTCVEKMAYRIEAEANAFWALFERDETPTAALNPRGSNSIQNESTQIVTKSVAQAGQMLAI